MAINVIDWGIPAVRTYFNSTNGWGFGGGVGDIYMFDEEEGFYAEVYTSYYRHVPPTRHIAIYLQDNRIFDEYNTPANKKKAWALVKETWQSIQKKLETSEVALTKN